MAMINSYTFNKESKLLGPARFTSWRQPASNIAI